MNTLFDDEEVTAIYNSPFGAYLFNMYTRGRPQPHFWFTKRLIVVRRMIRAMLDAEEELRLSHPVAK